MHPLIAIAVGGAAGALTRFFVGNSIHAWLGRDFPHATLFINVSGSFLMGLLSELMVQRFSVAGEYRAAVLVGFLGAYTTFSTYALESFMLIEEGGVHKAFLNIFLSNALCILAVWVGILWGRNLFNGMGLALPSDTWAYLVVLACWIVVLFYCASMSIVFNHYQLPELWRLLFFIVILAGVAVMSTIWMSYRLFGVDLTLGSVFSVFIMNTLFGSSVLILANFLGNGFWRLFIMK